LILRGFFACVLSFFLITPSVFSQTQVDREIAAIQQSIRLSQARLKSIVRDKHKHQRKIEQEILAQNQSHPIFLSQNNPDSFLFAKDFTRYPPNPYPILFQHFSEDGTNNIQFHFWYQGDWDSLMNIQGLFVNDGLTQSPIKKSNSIQRLWNRRIRPTVQGDVFNFINYFFNVDFGKNSIALYDAFIDINYFRLLGFQFGKQMSLVSGIENFFDNFSYLSRAFTMEMSHTAMLAPDRQTGAMIHGSFGPSGEEPYYQGLSLLGFDDFFSYQMGIFTSLPDNRSPNPIFEPDGMVLVQSPSILNYDFQLRIFSNPFIQFKNSLLEHLGFGIALSTGNPNNQNELPPLNSIAQNMFYNYRNNFSTPGDTYTVIANGSRTRIHPQAVWSYGPFGIIGDWTQTNQTLALFNQTNKTYPYQTIKQSNSASMISFIYNLTQEKFNLFHLIPNNNFHLFQKNQYGALQLVLRLSQLNLDPSVFQSTYTKNINGQDLIYYYFVDPRTSIQKANSWSIGLNWYWNQFLRFTFEYDQSSYLGGCSTGSKLVAYGTPGCQTGNMGTYLPSSQVANRPDEKVFMQRIQVTF
jgi:phosphate-selective porin OprO/OprP